MSLSYMLSASDNGVRVQDPIFSASTARFMLRCRLDAINELEVQPLSLQAALPIVYDILAISAGYLACQPKGQRLSLDEHHLELLSMSVRTNTVVDECAIDDYTRALTSLLAITAEHLSLPALKDALPTVRAALAQRAIQYFAHDPLLNQTLALFVCQDIDIQIREGSPMTAVVAIEFLRDAMMSPACAFEPNIVDLGHDPGPSVLDMEDGADTPTLENAVRHTADLSAIEHGQPSLLVESDESMLERLIARQDALSIHPRASILELLRVAAAIQMKRQHLAWTARYSDADVIQQTLHTV